MPTNNGLVKRYSKLVNLQSRRGSPRPPTLVPAPSAEHSVPPSSNFDTKRADLGAYLGIALAILTYGGIAWGMGWLS